MSLLVVKMSDKLIINWAIKTHCGRDTVQWWITFIEALTYYVSSDLLHFVLHRSIIYWCIRFREGLSGIKVVIKTLSAGFHQPVERLRHVTLVGGMMTLVGRYV